MAERSAKQGALRASLPAFPALPGAAGLKACTCARGRQQHLRRGGKTSVWARDCEVGSVPQACACARTLRQATDPSAPPPSRATMRGEQ